MKKKILILMSLFLLLVLFTPVPIGTYKDGGTKEYTSLTYKIVVWNRIVNENTYHATSIFWFPDNRKSIDELWKEVTPSSVQISTQVETIILNTN